MELCEYKNNESVSTEYLTLLLEVCVAVQMLSGIQAVSDTQTH